LKSWKTNILIMDGDQWAASLTPTTFRWRMRDVARLLADGIAAAIAIRPDRPVRLINIAGGPASDSLNALILLHKEQPGILNGRKIHLHVLDVDASGPAFGGRALAALQTGGAPLTDLEITFEYTPYDWANPAGLVKFLERIELSDSAAVGSSEGGLFEYASDSEIIANLQVLHDYSSDDFVMVGPVVRNASTLDERLKMTEHVEGRPAVRYIGLEMFGYLTAQAGWRIDRHLDGPMHQVVSLRKA
jgi:hypothetical protein